jgi:hypothetical protein
VPFSQRLIMFLISFTGCSSSMRVKRKATYLCVKVCVNFPKLDALAH